MSIQKTKKVTAAAVFDPKKAMVYFDLWFEEDNLEEDKENNPEAYQDFLKLGNGDLTKAALKAESMALAEAKKILKVDRINNEGHGSDGALVCKISVNSLKEAKAIFENVWRKVGGGDDIVYLNAPYMEMRGFTLYPGGVNDEGYNTKGNGGYGDVEEFFEEAKEGESMKTSAAVQPWTKELKSSVEAALRKANRPDLAAIVAATQEETVEYLKKAGILPPSEKAGNYPELGKEKTLESLETPPAPGNAKAKTKAKAKTATANNASAVSYLKQAGILPPGTSSAEFPEIGANPTWSKLHKHKAAVTASAVTAAKKKEVIAALLKAKRPDLANEVAKL